MAGVNRTSNNFNVVACSSRRKIKSSTAHFVPEEIIFNILLWLPTEVLYKVMRYVCREWAKVINDPDFINAHLQKSSGGFLIMIGYEVYSVEIRNGDVITTRLVHSVQGFPYAVYSSCNGLVFCNCSRTHRRFVINPITNSRVNLPPYHFHTRRGVVAPNITYVHPLGRYKVMFFTRDENNLYICLICTVGIDNHWRQIDIKHLTNIGHCLSLCDSFSAGGGYIYFTRVGACHLFALDAQAEIIHQFDVPNVYHTAITSPKHNKFTSYIVWKSFLALLAHCGEYVWEIWALTDLRSGEWTRLFNVDLRGQRCMIEQIFDVPIDESSRSCYIAREILSLHRAIDPFASDENEGMEKLSLDGCLVPIASDKNGEMVIFCREDPFTTYLVYNLKTQKVSSFVVDGPKYYETQFKYHVNSLVSLEVS